MQRMNSITVSSVRQHSRWEKVPWKLLSKAPLATALPPHRLGNHTATQCLPQLTLCKTRTNSYKPWEPPGFFRDHFLESLNIVTVPLGTWCVTKLASPCHTTLGLLPDLQPCRDISVLSEAASYLHTANRQVLCRPRTSSDSPSPRKTSQCFLLLQPCVLILLTDKPPFTPRSTDPLQ